MPMREPPAALRSDAVHALVAQWTFSPRPEAPALGMIGLESEAFPIWRTGEGGPGGRVPLAGGRRTGTLRLLEELSPLTETAEGLPLSVLPNGTRVTPEPGGQIEIATAARDTAAAALDDLDAGHAALARAYDDQGATLAGAGLDVWHTPASVPQQLTAPRYPAMAAYFAGRGPTGRIMMCHTASLQVNVCLGPPTVAAERWLVANLLAPLTVATFAASPVRDAVSGRAQLWRRLDPTRTGVPRSLVDDDAADPVEQLVDAALHADVLLVRTTAGCRPGRPGWPFGAWVTDGDPALGRPTAEDLRYHLTTLFPEVRARGFLELRGIDALPVRWRAVPVVLLAGALYDDRARQEIRGVLERHRRVLPALLERATVVGVASAAVCAMAVEAWSFALAGANRLPAGYFRRRDVEATEMFLDRFTMRGRCPSDELGERLADSPAAGLAWAGEPIDTLTVR